MIRRSPLPALLVLTAGLAGTACVNAVDQTTESHAAETRARDEQSERIRAKDEKSGPKDTTVVVGQDSIKLDGGR